MVLFLTTLPDQSGPRCLSALDIWRAVALNSPIGLKHLWHAKIPHIVEMWGIEGEEKGAFIHLRSARGGLQQQQQWQWQQRIGFVEGGSLIDRWTKLCFVRSGKISEILSLTHANRSIGPPAHPQRYAKFRSESRVSQAHRRCRQLICIPPVPHPT